MPDIDNLREDFKRRAENRKAQLDQTIADITVRPDRTEDETAELRERLALLGD